MIDVRGRAQPTMDGATPARVVLHAVRKQAEQAGMNEQPSGQSSTLVSVPVPTLAS